MYYTVVLNLAVCSSDCETDDIIHTGNLLLRGKRVDTF